MMYSILFIWCLFNQSIWIKKGKIR